MTTQKQRPVLGVLGGLGPAATCYFYQMITDHTPAKRDQDHLDIVISSRASTPDRSAFVLGQSKEDPFVVMERDAANLVRYGATVLTIPCNTAHFFYDRLAEALPVPILNMVTLTVQDAQDMGCTRLGILATSGTVETQSYQQTCEKLGLEWVVPSAKHQAWLMEIIYGQIKSGQRADMAMFTEICQELVDRGCQRAVLGCTELSLIKRDEKLGPFFIDSTEVLVKHTLRTCGIEPIGF